MERLLRTENAELTENVTWCQGRLVSASAGCTEVWRGEGEGHGLVPLCTAPPRHKL